MRLAIVGSRSFTDYKLVKYWAAELCRGPYGDVSGTEIISGGASGTDSQAAKLARAWGAKLTEHLPDYEKYGKDAPKARNELIVKDADMVLAFWTGEMKSGTRNALNWAKKYRKPTMIVYV